MNNQTKQDADGRDFRERLTAVHALEAGVNRMPPMQERALVDALDSAVAIRAAIACDLFAGSASSPA
ncbi:hypothetical protein [Achromobacter aegrifaciens]